MLPKQHYQIWAKHFKCEPEPVGDIQTSALANYLGKYCLTVIDKGFPLRSFPEKWRVSSAAEGPEQVIHLEPDGSSAQSTCSEFEHQTPHKNVRFGKQRRADPGGLLVSLA